MNSLSYEEYFELPNKEDIASTPVSYNYDRQFNEALIRVWQPPDRSDFYLKFTYSRKIYNIENNSDEPDFPMEWHQAIVYNLAVRIAPIYGKHKDAGFQELIGEASKFLADGATFDNEVGSIYIRAGNRYG
jgi:hypothetical protein